MHPPLHASCVAWQGKALLLRGDSGMGKSTLALELIARGWVLVADDYTELEVEGGVLIAAPVPRLRGLLEVRHVGIIPMPVRLCAPVKLVIDLLAVPSERLPPTARTDLLGVSVPVVALPAHSHGLALRTEAAWLQALGHGSSNPLPEQLF